MKHNLLRSAGIIVAGVSLWFATFSYAQSTNSGDIRGTVTDTSGAAIAGATVTILNVQTGVSKTVATNNDGLYDTSSIVIGDYTLTFHMNGFATFVRGPITLITGDTSINAVLKPGAATEKVVVTADVPLLTTDSGEQSETLESATLEQLPQTGDGESWYNFTVLLPGFAGAASTSQGSANPGQYVSANGNLPFVNTLSDGASVTTDHSQNAIPDTFDAIAEVQVNTSSFSAEYGIGGVVFNQITKGGTERFHGDAYEFFQNNALNAAQFGFVSQPTIPFLRYDEFGGSIGGPVLRKKMFFFFNYDQIVDHGAANNSTNSVPTSAVMAGTFTGEQTIYDPTTQVIAHDSKGNPYPVRQSFQSEYGSNAIPANLIDSVSANFQKFYPTPTSHVSGGKFVPGTTGAEGEIQNNFFSSVPQSTPNRAYFGRLDYDITPKNRLFMSDMDNDTPARYPSSVTACPINCEGGDVETTNSQITDVWTISPNTVNEARMGFMYQGNFFVDESLGGNYPSELGWQFAKANTIPTVQFTNTDPYFNIGPASNAVYKSMTFDPSDVMTLVRGRHILHLGGEFLFYREDSTAWGNTNAGTLQFSGQYTQKWTVSPSTGVASPNTQTGLEYADFLLGYAQSWNASVAPEYGGRLKSPQVFVQDDYKVRPDLTLNFGLRYQINHGWNEVHGNMSSFDPTVLNSATNTLGAYWYGTTHANGRTSLQSNRFNIWLPRLGFSWLVTPKTTLRGGFGLYSQLLDLDNYGGNNTTYGMGGEITYAGSIQDQTNGIIPVTKFDGSGTVFGTGAPLPYTSPSTNPDRYNGQAVGYIQYHSPVPMSDQWNVAVQRALTTNFVAQLSYVGNHGSHLFFNADINQVPIADLSANDAGSEPYPQYESITGSSNNGISNYNSLQASLSKRMNNGFSLNLNYVWSHFLDDQDSSGRGGYGGPAPYQIANNPAASYSNSNFDVRNAFKGYGVYELPFGLGRKFLNQNRLLDDVIGGWQVSGTTVLSSGNPFTVYSTQNTYALGGSAFPNRVPGVSTKPAHRSARCETGSGQQYGCINEWYNPAAFSLPADGTFGDVRRNSLYGPGLEEFNLSAGKNFNLRREGTKLEVRADAVNAFNHASFGLPTGTLSGATGVGQPYSWVVGANSQQISSTTVGGRTVQLSARITF